MSKTSNHPCTQLKAVQDKLGEKQTLLTHPSPPVCRVLCLGSLLSLLARSLSFFLIPSACVRRLRPSRRPPRRHGIFPGWHREQT